MDPKEVCCQSMDWVRQGCGFMTDFCGHVNEHLDFLKASNFFPSCAIIKFSRRNLHSGVNYLKTEKEIVRYCNYIYHLLWRVYLNMKLTESVHIFHLFLRITSKISHEDC